MPPEFVLHVTARVQQAARAKDAGVVRSGAGGGDHRVICCTPRANCRARKGHPCPAEPSPQRAPDRRGGCARRGSSARASAARDGVKGAGAGLSIVGTTAAAAEGDLLNTRGTQQPKSEMVIRWACPVPSTCESGGGGSYALPPQKSGALL